MGVPREARGGPTGKVEAPRPGLTPSMRSQLMSKLPLDLGPTRASSNPAHPDGTRELGRAASAMARRMVRARARRGVGAAWTWYLDHARRRFGASGWRVAQAAG